MLSDLDRFLDELEPEGPDATRSEPAKAKPIGTATQTDGADADQEFDVPVDRAAGRQAIIGLPSRRCRVCKSWLFWVSVYGLVACSICDPPRA